jgi:hypothetical protein
MRVEQAVKSSAEAVLRVNSHLNGIVKFMRGTDLKSSIVVSFCDIKMRQTMLLCPLLINCDLTPIV